MAGGACASADESDPSRVPTHEECARPSSGMRSRRRALVWLVTLALAGHVASIAYEISLADRFGTGVEADALALSLTLVVAVANEIGMWVSTLFIPRVIETATKHGPDAAARFFRRCLLSLLTGTGVLALAFILGASVLVGALSPDPLVAEPSGHLARFFALLVVLLPLSVLLAGSLHAQGRFALAGLRQLCWYGTTLGSLLALSPRLGASAVPLGMVVGLGGFCLILGGRLWTSRARTSPSVLSAGEGSDEARPLGPALIPLALASLANYVNVSIERGIAARLPEGSLAALTYAFRLLHFPVNLLLVNATLVLLPSLAAHAAREEHEALQALLLRALRLTLVFTIPLAGLSMVLAQPVIQILLERGAFTAHSTTLTATALVFYGPGVIGIAGSQVLARAYQALHEVRRLVVIGIAVIGINIPLMLVLTHTLGFPGLPTALSVSPTVLFVAMLIGLRRRLPGLDLASVGASAWRIVLAGVLAAGGARALTGVAPRMDLLVLLMGAGGGLAVFGLALFCLSRDDARLALALVFPRLGRLAEGPS
jgi:putative peptidoglycan lipid II flippase